MRFEAWELVLGYRQDLCVFWGLGVGVAVGYKIRCFVGSILV